MLWISEPEVAELVDLDDAIRAQEQMLAREAAGEARNMPKALGHNGERNAMHAPGSMAPATGHVGFKHRTHNPPSDSTIHSPLDYARGPAPAIPQGARTST